MELTWSPADGGSVNVLRNGVVIHTTNDDGEAQDRLGRRREPLFIRSVKRTQAIARMK